ncbi:hypothetical protein JTE90_025362 [Oedothorax gibbosus]|uniref:Dynamin-type G domain-containing protein n=1 Tax=Oedothorax gibbosus TaxID=931172 RepID=A0AAV6U7V8_9ARAC|nr:hypothetical protein JTE90_025362 [Oedothorax gibbosus]
MYIIFAIILASLNFVNAKGASLDNAEILSSRSRDHFKKVLKLNNIPYSYDSDFAKIILDKLFNLYLQSIKPLEDAYYFKDMGHHLMTEGEIFSVPMITLLGPWSTGKSSLINYILGIENSSYALNSGAQPTTSDFTVLSHNDEPKSVEGNLLVMAKQFSCLTKYGELLLERLRGVNLPCDLLKLVTFVDTPGVIENRKQQERGFPFDEISQWFIDQSDLVLLVFDPAKLDIGTELEKIFKHLKGYEAKTRIILNKADSVTSQDLLRVYGSLFWNLSPLINVTEPPQVYLSSFWSKPFGGISKEFQNMFLADEESLLSDIYEVMSNRLQSKVATLRKYATMVRNHALVVDSYIGALAQHRSIFVAGQDIADDILEFPSKYRILQKVVNHRDVSEKDLFTEDGYRNFFTLHSMEGFTALSKQCGFISLCILDAVENVIYGDLPALVREIEARVASACAQSKSCKTEL